MTNIIDLKKEILSLKKTVAEIRDTLFVIKDIPLSTVAKNLEIKKQTLTYHIKQHYKDGRDFYKQNGIIYISVGILQNIKAHYEK